MVSGQKKSAGHRVGLLDPVGQYERTVHVVAMPATQYEPAGHGVEIELPAGHTSPTPQLVGADTSAVQNDPFGHVVGADADAGHEDPAGQGMGVEAPAGQYAAAGQGVENPLKHVLPPGQMLSAMDPARQSLPFVQGVWWEGSSQYAPAGHVAWTVEPAGHHFPGEHDSLDEGVAHTLPTAQSVCDDEPSWQ